MEDGFHLNFGNLTIIRTFCLQMITVAFIQVGSSSEIKSFSIFYVIKNILATTRLTLLALSAHVLT